MNYPPPSPAGCANCGQPGTLRSRSENLTVKKRSKFGFVWLLVTICTLGLGLLIWLIWPRHKEVVGVDRWNECSACGVKQ